MRQRAAFISALPSLLEQTEAQLRRRLAAQSEDALLMRRLADTQRMLGQLAAARDSYRRVHAMAPDPAVRWLVDVLGADPLPTPPEGVRAVPFARVTNFLNADDQQWLLATTLAAPECFVPALVADSQVKSHLRSAFVAGPPLLGTVRRWFKRKLQAALPAMLTRLASDCRGLRGDRVADCGIETSITMHRIGDFYQGHRDVGNEDYSRSRRISFVYYFGREPRRFEGGDLLLHDTNYEANSSSTIPIPPPAYSRIAPVHNSLLIFPSDSLHEVTRIASPTGEPLDFGDCRFTVNGWIHEKKIRHLRRLEEAP